VSGCDWLRFGLLTGLGLLRSNCASGCDQPVFGSPDLESLTVSHIERVFLSVRQELKRFQRKGLGYSKDLATHKAAAALHFGVYNLVRRHRSLGATPAVAAGIEERPWGLERVVQITEEYLRRKEDAKFEAAFAERLVQGSPA